MDLDKEFATDEKLEVEGRWVPYDDKTSFKIARSGNKHYSRLFSRLVNQHKIQLGQKGDAAEALAEKLLCEVMAKTVLKDWKGTVKVGGEVLPYSEENALKVLAYKEFRRWVTTHADDMEAFKLAQEAEDEKNLKTA